MTNDEYIKLFHELELNLVAFKPLMQCDQEVLKLVNAAIKAEREACAQIAFNAKTYLEAAAAIRARGQE
jgi:hypothetical protein